MSIEVSQSDFYILHFHTLSLFSFTLTHLYSLTFLYFYTCVRWGSYWDSHDSKRGKLQSRGTLWKGASPYRNNLSKVFSGRLVTESYLHMLGIFPQRPGHLFKCVLFSLASHRKITFLQSAFFDDAVLRVMHFSQSALLRWCAIKKCTF